MEISEMGVLKQMDAIKAWQADPNVHELTCGSDSCNHVKLIAKAIPTSSYINLSGQEGSKIVLECPECDYTQDFVPDCVYKYYIDNTLNYKIPLGQVVEIEMSEDAGENTFYTSEDDGIDQDVHIGIVGKVRGIVVGHSRDCDGTPLYCISNLRVKYHCANLPEGMRSRMTETMTYSKWAKIFSSGWGEGNLKVLDGQFVPLLFESIFEYEEDMMSGLK